MATAGDVLTRLREKLNDATGARWPDAEHYRAMTDALNAILEARPDLFEKYAFVSTVAGSAQNVPADCYRLFDVVANCDQSDARVGGITPIDRATLDRHRRDWITMAASAIADHWMQDEREWGRFYLVPGQPAVTGDRGKLELRYAVKQGTISSSGSTINGGDEVLNAVYNFCMHRALEKDEKFAGSPTAESYIGKFSTFLGVKSAADDQFSARRDMNESN